MELWKSQGRHFSRLIAARRAVYVQAYSFTSAPIAKALVAAEKRGVDVEAILDESNQTVNYSSADFLAHEGVPTFIDAQHAIANNKIMILDGEVVLAGSLNFTKAAEKKNTAVTQAEAEAGLSKLARAGRFRAFVEI